MAEDEISRLKRLLREEDAKPPAASTAPEAAPVAVDEPVRLKSLLAEPKKDPPFVLTGDYKVSPVPAKLPWWDESGELHRATAQAKEFEDRVNLMELEGAKMPAEWEVAARAFPGGVYPGSRESPWGQEQVRAAKMEMFEEQWQKRFRGSWTPKSVSAALEGRKSADAMRWVLQATANLPRAGGKFSAKQYQAMRMTPEKATLAKKYLGLLRGGKWNVSTSREFFKDLKAIDETDFQRISKGMSWTATLEDIADFGSGVFRPLFQEIGLAEKQPEGEAIKKQSPSSFFGTSGPYPTGTMSGRDEFEEIYGRARDERPWTQRGLGTIGGLAFAIPQMKLMGEGIRRGATRKIGKDGTVIRTGLSKKYAAQLANVTTWGMFSALNGGDFDDGAVMGFLTPLLSARMARLLGGKETAMVNSVSEGIGLAAAGSVVHGFSIDSAMLDFFIGLGLGGHGYKPTPLVRARGRFEKALNAFEKVETPEQYERARTELKSSVAEMKKLGAELKLDPAESGPVVEPEAGAYEPAPKPPQARPEGQPQESMSPRARAEKDLGGDTRDAPITQKHLDSVERFMDRMESDPRVSEKAREEIENLRSDMGEGVITPDDVIEILRGRDRSTTEMREADFKVGEELAREAFEARPEGRGEAATSRVPGEEHIPTHSSKYKLPIVIDESLSGSAEYRAGSGVIAANPKRLKRGDVESVLAHEEAHHTWRDLSKADKARVVEAMPEATFAAQAKKSEHIHGRRGTREEMAEEWFAAQAAEIGSQGFIEGAHSRVIRDVLARPEGAATPGSREGAPPPAPKRETAPAGEPEIATSIKEAQLNRERFDRGLGKLAKPFRRKWEKVADEAAAEVAADPDLPADLVVAINEAGSRRGVSDLEGAILDIHRINLHRKRALVDQKGVEAAEGNKPNRLDQIELQRKRALEIGEAFIQADLAAKRHGTEAGRALAFQRAFMDQNYTILKMEAAARAEFDYAPLEGKKGEAIRAKVKARHDQHRVTQAKLEAAEARNALAKAEKTAGPLIDKIIKTKLPKATSKKFAAKNKIFTREGWDKRHAALKERWARGLSANEPLNPKTYADLLYGAGMVMEAGARTFKQFAKAMHDLVGSRVKPHLRALFDDSRKQLSGMLREEGMGRVEAGLAEGKSLLALHKQVGKIAESVIAEGARGHKQVNDAVHKILSDLDPKITRNDVMEALTRYGQRRLLDKDSVKEELRQVKGETRELLKIQDMRAGKPPKATGQEQATPGPEWRKLTAEVNELKRQNPDFFSGPNTLRNANDAVERRLTNRIEVVREELRTGTPAQRNRTTLEYNAKNKALRKELDGLLKQRRAMFKRPKMSEAQRARIAMRAVERSIKELERRISEGDFSAARKRADLSNPELDAARARRDALREELKALKQAANPPKTHEEIVLQTRLTRLKNKTAKLAERHAARDFADRPKREVIPDSQEVIEARAAHELVERAWNKDLLQWRLENRNNIQRVRDTIVGSADLLKAYLTSLDISFVGRQGEFQLLGHPLRTIKSMTSAFRGMSKEGHAVEWEKVRARENFPLYGRDKLDLVDPHAPGRRARAEEYQSQAAEKIWGLVHSQRSFEAMGNRVRVDAYDVLAKAWTRTGVPTPAEGALIANLINITTGRPNIGSGKLANWVSSAGSIMWAPRLVYSRFLMAIGTPVWTPRGGYRGTGKIRVALAKEYGQFLLGLATVYKLMEFAGAQTPLSPDKKGKKNTTRDPYSTDFGKVIDGTARIDLLGGVAQAYTFMFREIFGQRTTSRGKTVSLRAKDRGYGGMGRLELLGRFMRSKGAPVAGLAYDIADEQDYLGRPTVVPDDVDRLAYNISMPMAIRDSYEALRDYGVPKGAAMSLAAIFGWGVQDHNDREREKKKSRAKIVWK